MIDEEKIKLWRERLNQTEEPKPTAKRLTKREKKFMRAANKKDRPISFRPTKENSDFLSLELDKSATINYALDKLRGVREE